MDEQKSQCMCAGCKNGTCGGMHGGMGGCGCHGGRHHLVKMILKLVIIIIIFWCGFKLGEMTGFIRAEYGRVMMREGYGMVGGNVMMPGIDGATPTTPAQ